MFWTIISSVFTSLITTRFTYHGDTLKELRKSRETLYTEVFKNIERLINDTELVFQDEFINSLVESKYKVKLIASDRVVSAYVKLFSLCMEKKSAYDAFLQKNDSLEKQLAPDEEFFAIEADMENFKNIDATFRTENAPSKEYVSLLIKNVLREMRYDVGNHPWKRFIKEVKDLIEKVHRMIASKKSEQKKEVL